MANLLEKFRINFSQLIMLQGVYDMPKQETIKKHKALLNEFILDDSNGDIENELKTLEEKTHRQLRLHELVKEHSSNANLIVMSLPMPRKVSFVRYLNRQIKNYSFSGFNITSCLPLLVGNVDL